MKIDIKPEAKPIKKRPYKLAHCYPPMCTPPTVKLSNGCLSAEGRGVALGGKQRVRCYHLIPTPPLRQTPNEAKGGSPYREFIRLTSFKVYLDV